MTILGDPESEYIWIWGLSFRRDLVTRRQADVDLLYV